MQKSKRLLFIYSTIGLFILALSQCSGFKHPETADIRGKGYADPKTCIRCHKDIGDTFSATAHFHTSSEVKDTVGTVKATDHTFMFDDSVRVVIERRKNRIYQVSYSGKQELEAHTIDIAFGSGEKAYTYATWNKDNLFQLPLTYFRSVDKWTNSPGFPAERPDFNRAILSRCLECHGTFAATKIVKTGSLSVMETVEKGSVLYGVDCQRCHGPAAEHVSFHDANPKVKTAKYIIAIKGLTRQQKIDMCAVCHSGNDQKTQKSTFNFTPGDTLSNFYYPRYSHSTTEPDVHGNQYGMLAGSACFIKSEMDCSSCHNTHKTEKNNPALFSQRCMACHKAEKHPNTGNLDKSALASNCIDCHMPMQPSKLISFQLAGKLTKAPYLLRSHRIAIYPEDTQKILSYLKSK
jgi:hypothetical protein